MSRSGLRFFPGQSQRWWLAAFVAVVGVGALSTQQHWLKPVVAADDPAAPPVFKEKDAQIVPVVCVRPGEKKECVLSTDCTVGVTRSGGLSVREMGEPAHPINDKKKSWSKAGLTLSVPDFGQAAKTADSPQFAGLKTKGYDAFIVTAEAAADAAEGMYEIHLADDTCSGHCRTTLRVLVHRP